MSDWLTTKEAATYLKVHPKSVYRYVKSGKLRQHQPGGVGRPRFRREDLDALLNQSIVPETRTSVIETGPGPLSSGVFREVTGRLDRAEELRVLLRTVDTIYQQSIETASQAKAARELIERLLRGD